MIQQSDRGSTFNRSAAPTLLACLLLVGCGGGYGGGGGGGRGGGGYGEPPPPQPTTNLHAAYPIVRIQDAAPTMADFIEDVELGTLLTASVNGHQLTLYTFKNDTSGTSTCLINSNATGCAKVWPPLFAGDTSTAQGDFTLITRTDGLKQWAWRGRPLYFFTGGTEAGAVAATPPDERTGDTHGFRFDDVWFVVRRDPFETAAVNRTRYR